MISFGLLAIWVTLLIYQTYKWMFYRPHNFPPGKSSKTLKMQFKNLKTKITNLVMLMYINYFGDVIFYLF